MKAAPPIELPLQGASQIHSSGFVPAGIPPLQPSVCSLACIVQKVQVCLPSRSFRRLHICTVPVLRLSTDGFRDALSFCWMPRARADPAHKVEFLAKREQRKTDFKARLQSTCGLSELVTALCNAPRMLDA